MKKIMSFFIALGEVSFVLGFIVSLIEKRKEKKGRQEEVRHHFYGPYAEHFKRPLDFALALLALIIFSPIFAVTALLVRMKLGSPVIFSQERPGRNERIFKIYKFRTMAEERGEDGKLLSDEKRLTDFGKKLRCSSLDELPEFINILKGDMSLVGPRPLLPTYLSRYNERQAHRHDVRPGLTGLAQVNGRNSLSWEEKFEDDVRYVGNVTFIGDLKILFKTLVVVFRGTGISSNTSVTMEEFQGSK